MGAMTDPLDVDAPTSAATTNERLRAAGPFGTTDPRRTELFRVAAAARLLIDRLAATDAPGEVLAAAALDLEAAAEHLHGFRQGSIYEFSEAANAGAEPSAFFDHSPLIGKANPLAPPIVLEQIDDRIIGRARFGVAYEGPPGCVHGGYVAAAFDELLGATQGLGGQPGMTGTLTVRYRRPTPLLADLTFEGWLLRVEGRKTFVAGRCLAEGEVTAEAEGIFVSVAVSKFMALREAREERAERERERRTPDAAPEPG
jgi:acyl-coenzyme A thioesterase PaaI-like protein